MPKLDPRVVVARDILRRTPPPATKADQLVTVTELARAAGCGDVIDLINQHVRRV
jgi:hypothetical protein